MLREEKTKFFFLVLTSIRKIERNYLILNTHHRPLISKSLLNFMVLSMNTTSGNRNEPKEEEKKSYVCISGWWHEANNNSTPSAILSFRHANSRRTLLEVESKSYLHISIFLFGRIEKYEPVFAARCYIPLRGWTHRFTHSRSLSSLLLLSNSLQSAVLRVQQLWWTP